jgi:outer membrane protein assembly factor BamB
VDRQRQVLETIELADGGRLVLCDWATRPGYDHNLVRIDAAGTVVWEAELPMYTSPNCFVGLRADESTIKASTWSGHLVTLDEQTGKILHIKFTK